MNQERTDIIMKKFREMNLEEDTKFISEDHNMRLFNSRDINELKIFIMEIEKNAKLKQGKSIVKVDPNIKSLLDVEIALRKASGQVDVHIWLLRRLEVENMEIREMVASKLSTSQSKMFYGVPKMEKNHLKSKVQGKQRAKLQILLVKKISASCKKKCSKLKQLKNYEGPCFI
ncbi:hypothetical protein L1887_20933 [Cichorium endivia]|nr:hypothetical protein L1887_20933 [Cichorium endivia]